MSGPIVRKYGFANFDKIFGERELKHGVEANPATPPTDPTPTDPPRPPQDSETAKGDSTPTKS